MEFDCVFCGAPLGVLEDDGSVPVCEECQVKEGIEEE